MMTKQRIKQLIAECREDLVTAKAQDSSEWEETLTWRLRDLERKLRVVLDVDIPLCVEELTLP